MSILKRGPTRALSGLVAVAAMLISGAAASGDTILVSADYDVVAATQGSSVTGSITTNFVSPFPAPETNIGTLTSEVFFNAGTGIYTYTLQVLPSINNIDVFNTAFFVGGFNGVAGYSYSEALANSVVLVTVLEEDGRLEWEEAADNSGTLANWDAGEKVTFFFQSDLAPRLGYYNLIDGRVGAAIGFATVPTPGAATAGFALMGLVGLRRRRTA